MNIYKTKGVCSSEIKYKIVDGKIKDLKFIGGCDGNLKGLSSLSIGMDIDQVIEKLEGIKCGIRKTSCPDQLANLLKEYKLNNNIKRAI